MIVKSKEVQLLRCNLHTVFVTLLWIGWDIPVSLCFRGYPFPVCTHWSCVNLLSVRPMKGRAALASLCLRSMLLDEPTWLKRPSNSCEGCRDFTGKDEGEDDKGGAWPILHLSPSHPGN